MHRQEVTGAAAPSAERRPSPAAPARPERRAGAITGRIAAMVSSLSAHGSATHARESL